MNASDPRPGKRLLLEILASEGVDRIFGNPGATELPLIDELVAFGSMPFELALQENSVIGMAEGYARATGRTSFASLHAAAGLAGGMSNLTNAYAHGTPMVVTAGQPDRAHHFTEPMLRADLPSLVRATTKWQHEVTDAAELATIMRRAFNLARTPPTGPVFVSLPQDVLEAEFSGPIPAPSSIDTRSIAPGLDDCAGRLLDAAAERIAIVAAEEVAYSGAVPDAVSLAEALDADVYGPAMLSATTFPTAHPLWRGMLGWATSFQHSTLANYDVVLFLGGQVGYVFPYSPEPAIPASVSLIHLTSDATQLGRSYPAEMGLLGDLGASIRALLRALQSTGLDSRGARLTEGEARGELDRARLAASLGKYQDAAPLHPLVALDAVFTSAPDDVIVVDESMSASSHLRRIHRSQQPDSFYSCRPGGLGWGMPFSVGLQTGTPDRPVLCVVGDGGASYAIQCLYSAARTSVPVVFALLDNHEYRVLKEYLLQADGASARAQRFVGLDLDHPSIDFVGIARSFGVEADRATTSAEVADLADKAFASGKPQLIQIDVARLGGGGPRR